MMRFELGLDEPDPKRAPISAGTIAASYLVGGLIPLAPSMMVTHIPEAFIYSVLFTGLALLLFGGIKGHFTGINRIKSAFQALLSADLRRQAPVFWRMLLGSPGGSYPCHFDRGQEIERFEPLQLRCLTTEL